MAEIRNRHDEELTRLYDKLNTLEPGSEEYDKVLSTIMKARATENEHDKIEADKKAAKTEMWIKIGTFAAGLVLAPAIDYVCKRSLTKVIGTVEQMETFTSTPGKSISSWFRMK